MITIGLEDNNDCIIGEDKVERVKGIGSDINFKKKLIFQVRSHRLLYDHNHKLFSNVDKKEIVWQQIAKKLKSNVENCKETWFEIRYLYQRHVRRLRNYFIHGQKVNCKRPAMYMETELTFLWRFIENRKTCKLPFDIPETEYAETETETIEILDINSQQPEEVTDVIDPINSGSIDKEVEIVTIDDDLILVEQPVEVIVIDEDDDSGKMENQFKLSPIMKSLVTQIKFFPELYDSKILAFKDYTRKSYIWNSIAGTLSDKATKLMKCWIIMQTRYEWEISQPAKKSDNTALRDSTKKSELQVELDFFKNYILNNPDTVYKQSYFLKSSWFDPIDYFKDIYNLIVRMKTMTDIVHVTDSLLKKPAKSKQYISLWREIASLKCSTAGKCETTWLIMRHFYWELMHMRQQHYQLTDKWYFETIISELYEISKSAQTAKQQELQVFKPNKKTKKTNKRPSQTNATSLGAQSSQRQALTPTTIQQITPTILNTLQSVPETNATKKPPGSAAQPLTLPKITAAISLAPQTLNNGMLQIKEIPCPPTLSPVPQQRNFINSGPPYMVALPASMSTTAASSQIPMSFNLPTQTIPTNISMPPLIRPITQTVTQPTVSPISQSLRYVRPRPAVISTAPKIQIASWATAPNASVNSITNPQVTVNSQISTSTSDSSNRNPTPTQTQTPTHSIASIKLTTLTPNKTPDVANIITPATTSTTTVSNSSQLPKITGVISLLNPNEILIELISSENGRLLVVHGPLLSAKYQLSMPTVAKFIREVLAIPLLHNKHVTQPGLIIYYWERIGQKFELPVYICRACWNFLLENFNYFPQIVPLKELMKPFQTALSVWKVSNALFEKFDRHCVLKGWLKYMKSLPDVVECIGSCYPVLYQDVAINKNYEMLSDLETECVWRTISLRFPNIPEIQEIWASFKTVFIQYMTDLENGIESIWNLNWWRTLSRLKFLVEARYTRNEPYFYIITNKMVKEIDRCTILEIQHRHKNDESYTALLSLSSSAQLVPVIEKLDLKKFKLNCKVNTSTCLTSLLSENSENNSRSLSPENNSSLATTPCSSPPNMISLESAHDESSNSTLSIISMSKESSQLFSSVPDKEEHQASLSSLLSKNGLSNSRSISPTHNSSLPTTPKASTKIYPETAPDDSLSSDSSSDVPLSKMFPSAKRRTNKTSISESSYHSESENPGSTKIVSETQNSSIEMIQNPLRKSGVRGPHKGSIVKKHFCFFCKTLQAGISMHLCRKHKSEKEVKEILKLTLNERLKKLAELKRKGDFLHNTNKEYNTGILIVCKDLRPRRRKKVDDYVSCRKCKTFILKRNGPAHLRKCGNKNLTHERKITNIHALANLQLRTKVFPSFRHDAVIKAIQYDELIIKFGNKLSERLNCTFNHHELTRNRLRVLGRYLTEIKKLDKRITQFKDVFKPEHFDTSVEALRKVANWDNELMWFRTPGIAYMVTSLVKKCGSEQRTELIKINADAAKKDVENFLLLWEKKIPVLLKKTSFEDHQNKKKKLFLPSKNDINKLYLFLKDKMSKAITVLENEFDENCWTELVKATLIYILIFNRRQLGEIERLTISDYVNMVAITENVQKEIIENMSAEAITFAKQFVSLPLRVELGRKVSVLLSPLGRKSIGLILRYRKNVGIKNKKNEYIFASQNLAKAHYRVSPLLKQYSSECGAEIPEQLRGLALKKHVATCTTLLSIEEASVYQFANGTGHQNDIHKNLYGVSIQVAEIPSLSKLLMAAVMMGDDDDNEEAEVLSNQYDTDQGANQNSSSLPKRKKRSTSPYGKTKRTKWTEEEQAAVWSTFGNLKHLTKLPSGAECLDAVNNNAALKNRTPQQLKTWIDNQRRYK